MQLHERPAALKQSSRISHRLQPIQSIQYHWVWVGDKKFLWDSIHNRHVLDDKDSIGTYYGILCFINKKGHGEPLGMITWVNGWPNDNCKATVKIVEAKEFNQGI